MHRIKERRKRSHQSKNPFVYAQGTREEKQAIEILTSSPLLATIWPCFWLEKPLVRHGVRFIL